MPFFKGTPESYDQRFLGGPEQRGIYNQLTSAAQRPGAGGAFGDASDYYRGLLSNDSEDFNAFAKPELRRFHQETIPGLAEQFAGMGFGAGSGGGGSFGSGFQNAAANAGTDLSERLGAMRANLRMQGAQGLQNIGQSGLGNFFQNTYTPPQEGLLGSLAPGIGSLAGSFLPGFGSSLGKGLGEMFSNWMKPKGSSSPYGNPQGGQP